MISPNNGADGKQRLPLYLHGLLGLKYSLYRLKDCQNHETILLGVMESILGKRDFHALSVASDGGRAKVRL